MKSERGPIAKIGRRTVIGRCRSKIIISRIGRDVRLRVLYSLCPTERANTMKCDAHGWTPGVGATAYRRVKSCNKRCSMQTSMSVRTRSITRQQKRRLSKCPNRLNFLSNFYFYISTIIICLISRTRFFLRFAECIYDSRINFEIALFAV